VKAEGDVKAGDVLSGALAVYSFISKCKNNLDKGDPCTSDPIANSLARIEASLVALDAKLDATRESIKSGLADVVAELKSQDVSRMVDAVQARMLHGEASALKLSEFLTCVQYMYEKSAGNNPDACEVTNAQGNLPVAFTPSTEAELYATDGPADRMIKTVLGPFLRDGVLQEGELESAIQLLMTQIGGDRGTDTKSLLFYTFELGRSKLVSEQANETRGNPAFIPSTFINSMNSSTDYWVQAQEQYIAALVAAAKLLKRQGEQTPGVAENLVALAENGTKNNPGLALKSQAPTWTFHTFSDTPARVDHSLVLLGNGEQTRTSFYGGPSTTPAGLSRGFHYSDWDFVNSFAGAIKNSGTKMSRLQQLYPGALPPSSVKNPPIWVGMGPQTRRFELNQGRSGISDGDYYQPNRIYGGVPGVGPGLKVAGGDVFGDNVAVQRDKECVAPVRIWDEKPTQDKVSGFDIDGETRAPDVWNDSSFFVRQRGDGGTLYNVEPKSGTFFRAMVTTPAAPVFDYQHEINGAKRVGPGSLFRCDGAVTKRVKGVGPVAAYKLPLTDPKPVPRGGLEQRLSNALSSYSLLGKSKKQQCRKIQRVSPWGIAKNRKARDKTENSRKPVNKKQFTVSNKTFKLNRKLDKDRDKVICEPRLR